MKFIKSNLMQSLSLAVIFWTAHVLPAAAPEARGVRAQVYAEAMAAYPEWRKCTIGDRHTKHIMLAQAGKLDPELKVVFADALAQAMEFDIHLDFTPEAIPAGVAIGRDRVFAIAATTVMEKRFTALDSAAGALERATTPEIVAKIDAATANSKLQKFLRRNCSCLAGGMPAAITRALVRHANTRPETTVFKTLSAQNLMLKRDLYEKWWDATAGDFVAYRPITTVANPAVEHSILAAFDDEATGCFGCSARRRKPKIAAPTPVRPTAADADTK